MSKSNYLVAAIAATLIAGSATAAYAAMSAADTREAAMKALGGHMKALSAVAKGEMAADAGTVVHAKALADMSHVVPYLFPQGSGGGESRAKPEIWSDWAGFMKAADDFAAATPALVAAAESGDQAQIGAALGAVGKTCGGCHKPFRAEKK